MEKENCGDYLKIFPLDPSQIHREIQELHASVLPLEKKKALIDILQDRSQRQQTYNDILLMKRNSEHEKQAKAIVKLIDDQ